jgi:hypothetical protein
MLRSDMTSRFARVLTYVQVGGAFAAVSRWRWIFYIMFPFCALGFAALPWLLKSKAETSSLKSKLLQTDPFGGFLFISSTTSFLVAMSWGGTQEPWKSFRTIVPLILGALGMVATVIWEYRYASTPFLTRSLFHARSSYVIYFGAFAQGMLLYGQLYYT